MNELKYYLKLIYNWINFTI